MAAIQKITPFLWFDSQAEEAANFYVSVFNNAKILSVTRYSVQTPSEKPVGSVMTVSFQLEGQEFVGLNGGPLFPFSEAVSFVVNCETQEEIDTLWSKLSADPKSEACGWLKDQFGLSWQIFPSVLKDMLTGGDSEKSKRVAQAMLKMKKLDIAQLKKAYG